jgi:hypothetical protein
LSIRDTVNANQNIVVVAAVVVIAVAVLFIYMQGGGRRGAAGSGQAYYYDTVTKKVFTGDADQFPPIESPDGNPAVKAHFFSFGDCSEDERFIAYYEKYTDEAKAKLEEAKKTGETSAEDQMYLDEYFELGILHSVDGENWFDSSSEQFMNILDEKLYKDGKRAKYCRVK